MHVPFNHCMFVYSFRTYNLYVPKFSIKNSYSLNDVLTGMGMTDMFGDRADLSGILEGQKLAVSEVRITYCIAHTHFILYIPSSLCLRFSVGCAPGYFGCRRGWSHCCSCHWYRHHASLLPPRPCLEIQSSIYGHHH